MIPVAQWVLGWTGDEFRWGGGYWDLFWHHMPPSCLCWHKQQEEADSHSRCIANGRLINVDPACAWSKNQASYDFMQFFIVNMGQHILSCHKRSDSFHAAAQLYLEMHRAFNSYIFLWEGLTSHNLYHSDLFRMERSRITQSHPVITWSRHATHSWFQYRCQQRKRQREANKFLLHNHCTGKGVWKNSSCPPPGMWQTGICTDIQLWVCDYAGPGTAWLDDSLVTVPNTHLRVATDEDTNIWAYPKSHARDNASMSHRCYVLLKCVTEWAEHGRLW